jgi:predicted Fe-Mo cluster-binding NifX family protein
MRIAISTDNRKGLDSIVSSHFGHCPHFTLVDVEDRQVKEIRDIGNPFHQDHQPGQLPRFVSSLGANVILTGGMGQHAAQLFQQLGVEAVTGARGTVRQSVEHYLSGQLSGAEACREGHEHHAHHHGQHSAGCHGE